MAEWNPFEHPRDYVEFGGVLTPGLAEIVDASWPLKWDEVPTYATIGSFPRFTGKRLSHFTVKIRMYTVEDWNKWWTLKPLLFKLPKRGLTAGGQKGRENANVLDIYHPLLAAVDINACVIEEVMQPLQTNDSEWTIEIKCLEFRQPVIAVATAEGAKATPADPEDAQQNDANLRSAAEDAAFEAIP